MTTAKTSSKHIVTPAEVRPLAQRSDWMGAALVAHAWGVIFGAVALFAWWPSVVTGLLAVMVIGSRQLGLAVLMHEAAHKALFRTGWINEVVGQWLCARPVLAEMTSYRAYHMVHHIHTQTDKDPDLALSAKFPTTRDSLKRKFTRDLTGQTGWKLRLAQFRRALQLGFDEDAISGAKMAQTFQSEDLKPGVLCNILVFAIMWAIGDWWYWFAFWALPLLTWYQFVIRIRNIAEHAVLKAPQEPLGNARTTYADPVTAFFLAPYWVNYHLEHHLVMHVPCWRLPKLHRLLQEKGYDERMETAPSYWRVLGMVGWQQLSPERARAG
ncbi:MAG: fatty acid desaturase family protein [Pseudomonadota bacterium]